MGTDIQWNGRTIALASWVSPRYFWLATENTVAVDGALVGTSGGFRFTNLATGRFADPQGTSHSIELETRSNIFSVFAMNYTLRVDGAVVSEGKLPIKNVAAAILTYAVIGVVVAAIRLGARFITSGSYTP